MPINNESIGIATEVAIAKTYNVQINPNYELRAEPGISDFLLKGDHIRKIFEKENNKIIIFNTNFQECDCLNRQLHSFLSYEIILIFSMNTPSK